MKDTIIHILFFSHLLGFAAVVGGLISQLTSAKRRIIGAVLNGARWQLISGIALVGLGRDEYNMTAVGVKLGIVLVLLVACEVLRKKPQISNKAYWFLLVLVIVQTAVALSVAKEVVAPVAV